MRGFRSDVAQLKIFLEQHNELYDELCDYADQIISDEDMATFIVVEKLAKYAMKGLFIENIEVVRRNLFAAVYNACVDHLRKSGRQKKGFEGMPSVAGEVYSEVSSPDHAMIAAEVLRQLRNMVDQLPENERDVIRARFYEEKTIREIAQELDISEATARRDSKKGLDRLQDKFRRWGMTAKEAFEHFRRK